MSNSFAFVQNLNDYTNVSASSAEIISLSVNTFTNGPLTYNNVIGYTPASFATLASGTSVSLSTVNGVSETTVDNALVIPVGAYITSIILTNNGIVISSEGGENIGVYTSTTINSLTGGQPIIPSDVSFTDINDVGYSNTVYIKYVAKSTSLYVNVDADDTLTTGSLCAYITYVMATNSPVIV